jgi:hypothetical protein
MSPTPTISRSARAVRKLYRSQRPDTVVEGAKKWVLTATDLKQLCQAQALTDVGLAKAKKLPALVPVALIRTSKYRLKSFSGHQRFQAFRKLTRAAGSREMMEQTC